LYAAKKINNGITVPLLQLTAMLLTGWCHITLSRRKTSIPLQCYFVKIPSPLVCIVIQDEIEISV